MKGSVEQALRENELQSELKLLVTAVQMFRSSSGDISHSTSPHSKLEG